MPDPTVVVGHAGGYIHYRLDCCNGKITVEECIHDFDAPNDWNWRVIEQHDTHGAAWDAIGKKVGWK